MSDLARPTTGDLPSGAARGREKDEAVESSRPVPVELQAERVAYDVAVDAGDFDDTDRWIDAARSSRSGARE